MTSAVPLQTLPVVRATKPVVGRRAAAPPADHATVDSVELRSAGHEAPRSRVGRAVGAGFLYAAAFTVPTALSASFGVYGFIGGVLLDTIAGACMRVEDSDGARGDMLLDGLGLGIVSGAMGAAGALGLVATAATGAVVGALAVREMLKGSR